MTETITKRQDFAFTKVDEDKRLVTGWASVVTENGNQLVDRQGDVMKIDNLRDVVHQFVLTSRTGGVMHQTDASGNVVKIGEIVDSFIFDDDLQQALGVNFGKTGWLATIKVLDDATWARVKSGELTAFSIGGTGQREEIE